MSITYPLLENMLTTRTVTKDYCLFIQVLFITNVSLSFSLQQFIFRWFLKACIGEINVSLFWDKYVPKFINKIIFG